ncbi:hypothetical protein D5F01_LYC21937 [Larimichthys crocea]|uniref:Uncharacterized protein n=1 Tax=Larimichthys crocea TaxID=215358 RepID=A0A6G0HL75_LARCR|nr:hypothetical protein D5F01_LYC21937 [Larimichthys crocea]
MERFQMSPLLGKNREHVVIHVGSVCLAVISQLISDIFFTLDGCKPNALFQASYRNVSETFALEVTMDWWSRYYWIIIDFWSLAWLLYAVFSLCKRNVLGPESCNPEIHPPLFYVLWTMINMARVCSMIVWDRHDISGAVTLSWIMPVLSFYMLYMSYSNLNKHKAWVAINPRVFSVTRYLTQNGLAAFAWWTLLNALVDLGIVFKYKAGVPDPLISIVVLILVAICALTWFFLQTFPLNKYLRHTYSVYATLILGLGAMFTRSYRVNDLAANTVYSGFLMLLMTIMSLAHLIFDCFRTEKPLATDFYLTSEGCNTVCQPEGNSKHKLQK